MISWTVDFETRSRCDLKKCGLWKYAEDPTTEILCMAWKQDHHPARAWPGDDPTPLFEGIARGDLVHAHNAQFEFAIWPLLRSGVDLKITQMRDSMARACMVGLPSGLGALADAICAPVKKDRDGARLMMKMCKPDKKGNWVAGDLCRLIEYCRVDVESEWACERMLPDLPPSEQRLWELTVEMNRRGLRCDLDRCRAAIHFLSRQTAQANAEISRLTGGTVSTAKQVAKLIGVIRDEGTNIKSLSKLDVSRAKPSTDKAARLIDLRVGAAMSSVTKFERMISMACADGIIRGTTKYHGAGTGRWSGQGIQPHNFPRGTVKDVDTVIAALDCGILDTCYEYPGTALSSALRAMILPPTGDNFLAGDYSAIEARVLCWLAGEREFVQAYFRGEDTYVIMARKIYGTSGDVTPAQRQLGKKAELGCGYGLGHKKFRESCDQDGITITADMAQRVVAQYREGHPNVVQFWRDTEEAALKAVQYPGRVNRVGKVAFKCSMPWLMIRLPSGRRLWYYRPRIVQAETPFGAVRDQLEYVSQYQGKAFQDRTYGGRIVENITQAVARDVMAAAMIRLEEAGYRCVLTVHDEILVDAQPGQTESEFNALMSGVPDWADGLPIKVGSWCGPRYRK